MNQDCSKCFDILDCFIWCCPPVINNIHTFLLHSLRALIFYLLVHEGLYLLLPSCNGYIFAYIPTSGLTRCWLKKICVMFSVCRALKSDVCTEWTLTTTTGPRSRERPGSPPTCTASPELFRSAGERDACRHGSVTLISNVSAYLNVRLIESMTNIMWGL